jgi:hypothetical protein
LAFADELKVASHSRCEAVKIASIEWIGRMREPAKPQPRILCCESFAERQGGTPGEP